jgi:aspartyl-tRNA(Asn)/glutamyl-tRNA(Gln) amidotransferase subunit B
MHEKQNEIMNTNIQTSSSETTVDIGLEIHVTINSKTKLFSNALNEANAEPNTNVHPIDLGLAGTRPVLNEAVVEKATRLALALNCNIEPVSLFSRKHYVYPDLPEGFQLTQFHIPFAQNGHMKLSNGTNIIINEMHIEADAARITTEKDKLIIDYNRKGRPLVEIVTGTCFNTSAQVVEFLNNLRLILKHLDISNANMEDGDMRVDVNISCRDSKYAPYGVRAEFKNMNSISEIQKIIEIERKTQFTKSLQVQSTCQFNVEDNSIQILRNKQTADEYHQHEDFGIRPLLRSEKDIEDVRSRMPLTPEQLYANYRKIGINHEVSNNFLNNIELGRFYQKLKHQTVDAANITVLLLGYIQQHPDMIDKLAALIDELLEYIPNRISNNNARRIVQDMLLQDLNNYDLQKNIQPYIVEADENKIRSLLNRAIDKHMDEWKMLCSGNEKLKNKFIGYMRTESANIDMSVATVVLNKAIAETTQISDQAML